MIKRILLIATFLLVAAYLAASFTVLNRRPDGQTCAQVKVVVEDSASTCFITPAEVVSILKRNRLYPQGQVMDSIRPKLIEQELEKNTFIRSAECYKTPTGTLCIYIRQRLPILRVMPGDGTSSYYIDLNGHPMPGGGHAAHLPVATGHISREMAQKELHQFALLLREDEFWARQVEQINVTSEGDIELVPRVGNHILFLGKPANIESKLSRIRTFYDKGLSRVGWNRYSRISVEFDNQIICKRR